MRWEFQSKCAVDGLWEKAQRCFILQQRDGFLLRLQSKECAVYEIHSEEFHFVGGKLSLVKMSSKEELLRSEGHRELPSDEKFTSWVFFIYWPGHPGKSFGTLLIEWCPNNERWGISDQVKPREIDMYTNDQLLVRPKCRPADHGIAVPAPCVRRSIVYHNILLEGENFAKRK